MAIKPFKSIQWPGLPDIYTVPQVDDTLTTAGAAADAKATGDEIGAIKADLLVIEKYVTPEMFGAVGDGITDDTDAFEDMIGACEVTGKTCVCNRAYNITRIISIGNINFICNGVLYARYGVIIQGATGKTIKINGLYGANRSYSTTYAITIADCSYCEFEMTIIDNYTYGVCVKSTDSNGCYFNKINVKNLKTLVGITFLCELDNSYVNGNEINVIYNTVKITSVPESLVPYIVSIANDNDNAQHLMNANIINISIENHYQYTEMNPKIARFRKAVNNKINIERLEITDSTQSIDSIENGVLFELDAKRNIVYSDKYWYSYPSIKIVNHSNYLNEVIKNGKDLVLEGFTWIHQNMVVKPNNTNVIDATYKMLKINDNNAFEVTDIGVPVGSIDSVWGVGTQFAFLAKDSSKPSYIVVKAKGSAQCNIRMGNASDSAMSISNLISTENPYLNKFNTYYNYKPNPDANSSIFRSNEGFPTDTMIAFKAGVVMVNLAMCGKVECIGYSDNLILKKGCFLSA